MNKTNNKGGAAAVTSTPSREQLLAQIESLLQEKAQTARLDGITIEFAEGTTKKGNPFALLAVKGGPFGWRGINLRPDSWARLQELTADIDAAMATHFPGELHTSLPRLS